MSAPPRGLFDILDPQRPPVRQPAWRLPGLPGAQAPRQGGELSYEPLPEPPMELPPPGNLVDWIRHPTDKGLGEIFMNAGKQVLDEDVLPVADFLLRNVAPGASDLQSLMDAKDYSARTMNDLYAGRPLDALADFGYTAVSAASALPVIPDLVGATKKAGEIMERQLSRLADTQTAQRLRNALSHLDEDAWRIRDRPETGAGGNGNATADFLARYALPGASSLQSLMDAGDYSQQMWDDIAARRFLPALENAAFMAGSAVGALPLVPDFTGLLRKSKPGLE